MKKLLASLLCTIIVFGIAGCSSDKQEEKKEEQKEEKKTVFEIGETAVVEDIKITVNSTRIDEGLLGAPDNGNVYFVLDITLENTREDSFSSSSLMCYELKDADGRKRDISIGANLNGSLDTEIAPGEKGTGEIAFEAAPEGALILTFTPGFGDSIKFNVR